MSLTKQSQLFYPAIWFVIVAIVSLFLVANRTQLNVETNILKLLPKSEADPMLDVAFEQYASKNMRQLVILLESDRPEEGINAAKKLASQLTNSIHIEDIKTQVSAKRQQAIGEFLFKYRHSLLSQSDRLLLSQKNYDEFNAENLEIIFSPLAGGLTSLITSDPFLLSYRFSQSLDSSSDFVLKEGFLSTQVNNKNYILIVASLATSPFSQKTQSDLTALLGDLSSQWQQQQAPVRMLTTGAVFYAAEAYRTAEHEISTIGLTSLLLVILLILVSFRSLTPLLLTSIALASGIGAGLSIILFIFEEIHLITLVFGASLIGVAVDYAFHYFVISKSLQARQRVRKIFPAISLGLLSSVVGYLSLLTTPFPGLNQMALFCIVGLLVAYLTVILLFPIFSLKADASGWLLTLCRNRLAKIAQVPAFAIWCFLWLLPVMAIAIVLGQTVSQDNIRQFQTTSTKLQEDEAQIKSVLELEASNQFFLVHAKTSEQLLIQLEKIQPALENLVNQGIIDGFENLSQRLPSEVQQQSNYRLISDLYQSQAKQALLEFGVITQQQYTMALQEFDHDVGVRLKPEEWLNSEMGSPFKSLWLGQIDKAYVAIVPISGINDLAALSDINSNARFVDKVGKVTEVFSQYRVQTTKLLLVALLLITLMLSVRYGLLKAITIVSAPLFSISVTVIALFFLGVNLTLFNTLALFLIIGIGIDYGLFFAESSRLSERTFLAITLSALTTIFSFGLLALSKTVAIQAFGLTMLIGIASSYILSPIIGSLVLKHSGK